eukprot:7381743-Alexandrium_andersonii.AAC.1
MAITCCRTKIHAGSPAGGRPQPTRAPQRSAPPAPPMPDARRPWSRPAPASPHASGRPRGKP